MPDNSPIDWAFVKERRLELGLSREAIGAVAGYPTNHLRALEEGVLNGERTMTVGRLRRLAELLGVRMAELLVEARPELSPDRADDARRLGAGLMQLSKAPGSGTLAAGLNLTLEQLHLAADVLETRLEGTGIRLVRNPWRLATDPRALARREIRRLLAHARTADGLKKFTAKVVYRVITGDIKQTDSSGLGKDDRARLHHLINHGIVQLDARGGFCLHPNVAYGLGLDRLAGRAEPRLHARRAWDALGPDSGPLRVRGPNPKPEPSAAHTARSEHPSSPVAGNESSPDQ